MEIDPWRSLGAVASPLPRHRQLKDRRRSTLPEQSEANREWPPLPLNELACATTSGIIEFLSQTNGNRAGLEPFATHLDTLSSSPHAGNFNGGDGRLVTPAQKRHSYFPARQPRHGVRSAFPH
jgi:hypothetical protein